MPDNGAGPVTNLMADDDAEDRELPRRPAELASVRVTLSIGVVVAPAVPDGLEALLRQAGVAMYQAKRGGKARANLGVVSSGSSPPTPPNSGPDTGLSKSRAWCDPPRISTKVGGAAIWMVTAEAVGAVPSQIAIS